MPTGVLAAMFNTRFAIHRAGYILASDLLLDQAMIRTSPGTGVTDAGYDMTGGAAEPVATTAATGMAANDAGAMATNTDGTIKATQERLTVNKRAVEGGQVRVRFYIVGRPVEDSVTLYDERVTFDRHPADRPATAEHPAKFSKKTLEARAMFERAVVSKKARVVEEVGVHEDVSDQNETVRAAVRKTQVTVEDTSAAAGLTGMATKTSIATGTGIAGAIDRTLETSLSGTDATT